MFKHRLVFSLLDNALFLLNYCGYCGFGPQFIARKAGHISGRKRGRNMKTKYLKQKDGVYIYARRVPQELVALDGRKEIKRSLRTKDLSIAAARLKKIHEETEHYLQDLAEFISTQGAGGADAGAAAARRRYEAAVKRAKYYHEDYKDAKALSEGALDSLIRRLDKIEENVQNEAAVEAVLGGARQPGLKLSDVVPIFFDLKKGSRIGKSEDQNRRWRAPKVKAMRNFISVAGDVDLMGLSKKTHGVAFRDWWLARIENEGLGGNSANKDMGNVQHMVGAVAEHHEIAVADIFKGLRFSEDVKKRRLPVSVEFVRGTLLDEAALPNMPRIYRLLIFILCNTGARPSEIIGADDGDWHLSHEIPYIHIRPNEFRQLKNKNSERELPLVGRALWAAQNGAIEVLRPYREKPVVLLNGLAKYFRENEIWPSDQHSLYSLRHLWEDLMRAAKIDDRARAQLMGHEYVRPTYGVGAALSERAAILEQAAIS